MTEKVISVDQMRRSDAYTIEHFVPSKELMHRAADGVYHAYDGWQGKKIAIVTGGGNNGGDDFALAGILKEEGIDSVIYKVSDKLSEDGKYYHDIAEDLGVAIKDFDVDALHKIIQPLFKDKSIKRHEIHCVHDSTFDVYTVDNSTPFIEGFMRAEQSVRRQGDNRLTVYKFTSEEKAKLKLHQVMECVRQYIADHPREAYTIYSDEYFPPLNPARMFRGESCRNMYEIDEPRKSMTIDAIMDENGFYILINIWDDDEYLPMNWKRLKEMVNGKKTYFKSDGWWK